MILPEIRNSYDALVAVNYPARVHFHQYDEVYPTPADLVAQEIPRLIATGLTQFWSIDETETNGSFDLDAAMGD